MKMLSRRMILQSFPVTRYPGKPRNGIEPKIADNLSFLHIGFKGHEALFI
jgi:hypothetical protein